MRVVDSFNANGKIYAVCVGADVSYGMKVQKISVNGIVYDVKESFVKESLVGVMQLELLIDSKEVLPLGEATVIEHDDTMIEKVAS